MGERESYTHKQKAKPQEAFWKLYQELPGISAENSTATKQEAWVIGKRQASPPTLLAKDCKYPGLLHWFELPMLAYF